MDIKYAAMFAMHNRPQIEKATNCGCFHCLKIFKATEIKDWTDKYDTAICPYCGIDSVLPENLDLKFTEDILKKLNEYWF